MQRLHSDEAEADVHWVRSQRPEEYLRVAGRYLAAAEAALERSMRRGGRRDVTFVMGGPGGWMYVGCVCVCVRWRVGGRFNRRCLASLIIHIMCMYACTYIHTHNSGIHAQLALLHRLQGNEAAAQVALQKVYT